MSSTTALFKVGHRSGRRGSAAALVHRWSLGLAATSLVLFGWLMVAIGHAAQASESRVAAREPAFVPVGERSQAVARWIVHADYLNHRQFLVLYVEPLRDATQPPPGLTRWPVPGEAFLSPQLVADAPDRLEGRYGRFGGLIDPVGLAHPTERLVYFRPPTSAAFDERDGPVAIKGFGVDQGVLGNDHPANTLNGFQKWTSVDLYVLVVFVVGLPVLLLTALACRSNAERRDRRLAMLDALGAPTSARAWVLVGEAAMPTVIGSAIGGVIAVATATVGVRIPIVDHVVASNDLVGTRPAVAGIMVAATGFIMGLVLLIQLRGRAGAETRPRRIRRRFRGLAPTVFPLGLALTIFGAQTTQGGGSGYSPGTVAFLVGVAVTLASLPSVLGSLAAATGGLICRLGMRAGAPSAIVGGRWLKERPGLIARLCAAFVVALGLMVQVQVQQQWIVERTQGFANASAPESVRIDDSLVVVRTSASAGDAQKFTAAVSPEHVLQVFDTERGTVVAGDCDALRRLGNPQTCDGQNDTETTFTNLGPLGRALRGGTELSDPTTTFAATVPRTGERIGFVVLNTSGADGTERVARAAYANLTKPYISTPGEEWIVGGLAGAAIFNWVLTFGSVGLLVLVLAGGLAVASMFLTQVHTLGILGTFDGRYRRYIAIALWNVGVPLAGTAIVGSVVAAYLGLLTIQIRGTGHVSVAVLGAGTAMVLALAVILTTLCGMVATRGVRSWRPTVD